MVRIDRSNMALGGGPLDYDMAECSSSNLANQWEPACGLVYENHNRPPGFEVFRVRRKINERSFDGGLRW